MNYNATLLTPQLDGINRVGFFIKNTILLYRAVLIIFLVMIVSATITEIIGNPRTFLGIYCRYALTIGTLVNTRGLMELVALNIGYEMGILPPTVFAILVIMALVTTFMTTPLLNLIKR